MLVDPYLVLADMADDDRQRLVGGFRLSASQGTDGKLHHATETCAKAGRDDPFILDAAEAAGRERCPCFKPYGATHDPALLGVLDEIREVAGAWRMLFRVQEHLADGNVAWWALYAAHTAQQRYFNRPYQVHGTVRARFAQRYRQVESDIRQRWEQPDSVLAGLRPYAAVLASLDDAAALTDMPGEAGPAVRWADSYTRPLPGLLTEPERDQSSQKQDPSAPEGAEQRWRAALDRYSASRVGEPGRLVLASGSRAGANNDQQLAVLAGYQYEIVGCRDGRRLAWLPQVAFDAVTVRARNQVVDLGDEPASSHTIQLFAELWDPADPQRSRPQNVLAAARRLSC